MLVRFSATADRDAVLRRHAAVHRGVVGRTGFEVLELPAASARDGARALLRETDVVEAEPDGRVSIAFTPNDPLFANDPYTPNLGQWGLRKAQVDTAWDLQRGSPSIIVATIDTGVDAGHPDLQGALVTAPRFIAAADASCAADTTNRDDNGHGTHVSGIIGANGNNGAGIAGAAFGVKVMAIKALDCTGAGLLSDISSAITYAADHGARVINVSLGSAEPSSALQAAVTYAASKNALVVAAAGNCGTQSGTSQCPTQNVEDFPAAYPGVLAVGATDTADQPAPFSTTAPYVGLSAPGTSILSTFPTYPVHLNATVPGTSYAVMRGTSQAAPLVAAIAALVLSQDPTLTASAAAAQLRASADDVGPQGYDTRTGDGRVNALRALATLPKTPRYGATYQVQSAPASLAYASSTTLRTSVTNASNFVWSAAGASPVHVSTHWYRLDGTLVAWDGPRAAFAGDVLPGASVLVDVPLAVPVPKGTYTLKVDLVREGVAWFSAQGVPSLGLSVIVNGGYAATYSTAQPSLSLTLGTAPTVVVTVANLGTRVWPAAGPNPVRLASHLRGAEGRLLVWDGPRAILSADVPPGGTATITMPLPLPADVGSVVVELDLVQEGLTWFSAESVPVRAVPAVVISGYGARYSFGAPPAVLPGERVRIAGSLTNLSAFAWASRGSTPVRLASHAVDAAGRLVRWDGARSDLVADVAPNVTVTTSLIVDAPLAPGTYGLRVDLVRDGVSWFSTQGVAALELPLTVIADLRAEIRASVTTVSRAAPGSIPIVVKNTSLAALSSEGARPVNVSSHWLAADGTVLLWDGPRAPLPGLLPSGASVNVALALAAPPPGAAMLVIDLVQEGAGWFGTAARMAVTVTP